MGLQARQAVPGSVKRHTPLRSLGGCRWSAIDTGMVMRRPLETIWATKPTTGEAGCAAASRTSWTGPRFRGLSGARENPARWKGHPRPPSAKARARSGRSSTTRRCRTTRSGAFTTRLRDLPNVQCTGNGISDPDRSPQRRRLIGATWNEIDIGAKVWTVAGRRG